jgi:hypothetical protein
MSITEPSAALRARLVAYTGLSALIATRAFPQALPQGTIKPCLYYEQTDTETLSAMGTDAGIEASYFEITVVADSYSSMNATRRQVRKAVQRWSGTIDGFSVQDCFVEGTDEAYSDQSTEYIGGVQIKLIHQTT